MNKTHITSIIILTVGVILSGSLLVPIIQDAGVAVGDPVEFTNSTYNSYVGTYDVKTAFTITDSNVVDGKALVDSANTANRLVFTDTFYITYRSSGQWTIVSESGTTQGTDTLTCNAADGVAKFSSTSLGEVEYPYTVAYAFAGTDGEYIINSSFTHSRDIYVKDLSRVFVSTNQTVDGVTHFVTISNGVVKSGETVGTLTYDAAPVEGVYGVQTVSDLVATINGGTVNLGILLVPAKEIGTEPSGTSNLLYAIPVLVIVSLIIFAITTVRPRN